MSIYTSLTIGEHNLIVSIFFRASSRIIVHIKMHIEIGASSNSIK